MKEKLKKIARNTFNTLGIDLTKNLKYDRLTKQVLKKVLKENSSSIDIGCHKGEMLEEILKYAPNGKHFAFEPIPDFYKNLLSVFKNKNIVFHDCALSKESGSTEFNYVVNAPAYSGLKQRSYKVQPEIKKIPVKVEKLDDLIPANDKIDLIKIDVEGGEFDVLKGAAQTIKKSKPVVIFEFGLGASDFYQISPKAMFDLLNDELGLSVYTISDWLKNKAPLSIQEFTDCYQQKKEYYFIAS